MRGAIPTLSQYAFIAWCSVNKKHRDNFTFTFTEPYGEVELNLDAFLTSKVMEVGG
jgi:hypothetical protein